MERDVTVDGLRLDTHVAAPRLPGPVPAVVICHGFPTDAHGAVTAAATLPQLADRIARECGWLAMSFAFRGAGGQETTIIPSRQMVIVRMGHYPGSRIGIQNLQQAEKLLMEAVPPAR